MESLAKVALEVNWSLGTSQSFRIDQKIGENLSPFLGHKEFLLKAPFKNLLPLVEFRGGAREGI